MMNRNQIAIFLLSLSCPGLARSEQVDLPAPVLEWSFYILLIFALTVGLGIFFRRSRNNGPEAALDRLMQKRERKIHAVEPGATVTECVSLMNALNIGAMLVMEGAELRGIFTERDAMTRVLGGGLDPSVTRVGEVMTPNPICVAPELSLNEARGLITRRRIRHLPVVKDGRVLGMVSSGDLTHWLVRDEPANVRELVEKSENW
jgi:CBS domain-containing protein